MHTAALLDPKLQSALVAAKFDASVAKPKKRKRPLEDGVEPEDERLKHPEVSDIHVLALF